MLISVSEIVASWETAAKQPSYGHIQKPESLRKARLSRLRHNQKPLSLSGLRLRRFVFEALSLRNRGRLATGAQELEAPSTRTVELEVSKSK
ncbi:High osmolarity signaling protein [Actinidia chinensis var. chinensis]|uniref:High osmolarity signaling protein n=1 Tax=Actinidia chinensis var. chinensis TaxID=1590841 RepID=A0A2R6RYH0_ACTCC|nr:High osmolarity signaling protein [Actinidia chinensis var. chinensis]